MLRAISGDSRAYGTPRASGLHSSECGGLHHNSTLRRCVVGSLVPRVGFSLSSRVCSPQPFRCSALSASLECATLHYGIPRVPLYSDVVDDMEAIASVRRPKGRGCRKGLSPPLLPRTRGGVALPLQWHYWNEEHTRILAVARENGKGPVSLSRAVSLTPCSALRFCGPYRFLLSWVVCCRPVHTKSRRNLWKLR